jgi:hypothetical protein
VAALLPHERQAKGIGSRPGLTPAPDTPARSQNPAATKGTGSRPGTPQPKASTAASAAPDHLHHRPIQVRRVFARSPWRAFSTTQRDGVCRRSPMRRVIASQRAPRRARDCRLSTALAGAWATKAQVSASSQPGTSRKGQPARLARSSHAVPKASTSLAHCARSRARLFRSAGTTDHMTSVFACHALHARLSGSSSPIIAECTTRCRCSAGAPQRSAAARCLTATQASGLPRRS